MQIASIVISLVAIAISAGVLVYIHRIWLECATFVKSINSFFTDNSYSGDLNGILKEITDFQMIVRIDHSGLA